MAPSPWAFAAIYLISVPLFWRVATGRLGLFVTLIVLFAVIPVVDALAGRRTRNVDPALEEGIRGRPGYDVVLWAGLPFQAALSLVTAWTASHRALSPAQALDLVLSTGVLSGVVGITVAHELVHRPGRLPRAAGFTLLALVGYMHWGIEHVHGHHRWVATPRDPATARRGESLWAFFPRAVLGEARSAFRIEAERLRRMGRSPWHNRVLVYGLLQAALALALGFAWGPRAVLAWLGLALVAVFSLQVINYVEHYGLERRRVDDGTGEPRWERVTPLHSWNAAERVTNILLFNLQRHSDHHAHASRPYPLLRHHEESPQLPTGYAGMFLLALVPPLFRRVMHPRLERLG